MKNFPETPSLIVYYQTGERELPEVLRKILMEWTPDILNYPDALDQIRRYLIEEETSTDLNRERNKNIIHLQKYLLCTFPNIDPGLIDDLLIALDGIKFAFEAFQLVSNDEFDELLEQKKIGAYPKRISELSQLEWPKSSLSKDDLH